MNWESGAMATKERNHPPDFVVLPLGKYGNLIDNEFEVDIDFYATLETAEAGTEIEARRLFEEAAASDHDIEMLVVYQPVTVYRRKQGYETSKVDG